MKKQELLKVVKENKEVILEYFEDVFEQYVEEDCVQSVDGMEEMFTNDSEFMFDHFVGMFDYLNDDLGGFDVDIFDPTEFGEEDEDVEMFEESIDEIINILFGESK